MEPKPLIAFEPKLLAYIFKFCSKTVQNLLVITKIGLEITVIMYVLAFDGFTHSINVIINYNRLQRVSFALTSLIIKPQMSNGQMLHTLHSPHHYIIVVYYIFVSFMNKE